MIYGLPTNILNIMPDDIFYYGIKTKTNQNKFFERMIHDYIEKITLRNHLVILDINGMLFIHLHKFSENDMNFIIDQMLELYVKERTEYLERTINYTSILSDTVVRDYKGFFQKRFVQHNSVFNKASFKFYNDRGKIPVDVPTPTDLSNNDRELFNFVYLRWKLSNSKVPIQDYICGLIYKNYGKQVIGLTEDDYSSYKLTEAEKYADRGFLQIIGKSKALTLLSSFSNDTKESGWIVSAKNTSEAIIRNKIFLSNKTYKYYSEGTQTYKNIFDTLAQKFASSTNIFDDYILQLNVNKFFISDVLAVMDGSNCLSAINKMISKLSSNPTEADFISIIRMMDVYFMRGHFIPISLKKIDPVSKDPRYTKEVKNISGNKVKIINPPVGYTQRKVQQKLDELDYLVLRLIKEVNDSSSDMTVSKFLEGNKYITVDYNSFEYSKDISVFTYGGASFSNYYDLRFIFNVKLNQKTKKYSFEIRNNSVFIRPIGTASATGEGSINTASLNYIMTRVYSAEYLPELRKLASVREKILDSSVSKMKSEINSNAKAKSLYDTFKKMWCEPKIINYSSYDGYRSLFREITTILESDLSKDTRGIVARVKFACIRTYLNYLETVTNVLGVPMPTDYFKMDMLGKKINQYAQEELDIRKKSETRERTKLLNIKLEETKYKTKKEETAIKKQEQARLKQEIEKKYKEVSILISKTNLDAICSYELGILMNKNVRIGNIKAKVTGNNSVNISFNLNEIDKKKLILSEWGLISSRGVIVFDDIKFKGAKEIQDVLQTGIKMPALLKIGV